MGPNNDFKVNPSMGAVTVSLSGAGMEKAES